MADVLTLRLGEYINPAGHPLAGQPGLINAFAIRHPDGIVLVDTGIGRGHERMDALYGPGRRPLDVVLRENGIKLADVALVINSHLHFDHCGGNRLFPRVPIFVQATEFAAAQEPRFTVREWVNFPDANYQQLEGDTEIVPRIGLAFTPGHTPGTQAVLVATSDGLVLIAAQAIYSAAEYEYIRRTGTLPEEERTGDATLYLDSARRLIRLDPDRVLFSHDAAAWEAHRSS